MKVYKKAYKNEDGLYHRVNGPAVEWGDNEYEWCYNGQYHRYYGPARLLFERHKFWIFGRMVR